MRNLASMPSRWGTFLVVFLSLLSLTIVSLGTALSLAVAIQEPSDAVKQLIETALPRSSWGWAVSV